MNFATWSIRNPIAVIVIFALLALAGLRGFHQLSIQNMPDLELPTVNIALAQPGAAPSQLETEVVRKVEDAVAGLAGVKHIRTSISDGRATIAVEFVLERKLSDALIETKAAVDQVRSDLPEDLHEPNVSAVTFGANAILTYAVASSRMSEEALSWFVDDTVSKAILAVPGVGRVERVGGVQREVQIEVDPARLTALGVTAVDVSRALRQVQQDSSGGRGQLGQAEQAVRIVATVREAAELAALPLAMTGGRALRLDQVATVTDGIAERSQAALLDGERAVGFRIYRGRGQDETRIADGVQQALAKLQMAEPSLSVSLISSTVGHTLEQYRGSMELLVEGALLAILVVGVFLRDWRATLIAAAALPLSILPTFAAMAWFGFSLNTLTLLALAVVVGVLVDDAIVEIENIKRHAQMGKSMLVATGDAVSEIALAVMATTLALVVVFLPTALMGGISGLLFKQFGWTVVVAVLASLLVARLLVPMLGAYLLKSERSSFETQQHSTAPSRPMMLYLATARMCLRNRKTSLALATLTLVASVALVPWIPTGLISASDEGYTSLNLELPPGSTLSNTLAATEATRLVLRDVPGIQQVFATIGDSKSSGRGLTRAGEVRMATLTLMLAPRGERESQADLESRIRPLLARVPGVRFTVGSGGLGDKLSIILASDNAAALNSSAQALVRELRGVAGLTGISSTAALERPEIIVRPDIQRAAERGVTAANLGATIRVATSGDLDVQLARLNLDQRQIYIRVRMPDAARGDPETLANLRVNGRGSLVPLSSVANLTIESGPSQISRYDRRRYVTVSADLGTVPLGEALTATKALPAVRSLPGSVHLSEAGGAEIMAELSSGFGMAILTGVLCIYCVLVLLFKDFLQPITILSAIPLSLGGAFVALVLGGSQLDVSSLIGLVLLMGIVTKNSILLVDYAIVGIRDRSLGAVEALIDACHMRARPIVMTTVAMIAGMLPIALGLGADASFRRPMAVAVIGGLITSTALSLFIVPVVFTYVDTLGHAFRRLFGARPSGTDRPLLQQATQADAT